MTIRYMDYENGANANNGSTWALAKKTFNGFDAVAVAGDTIRVAKSPDPTSMGQSASWTNKSKTVTLASAVTASISNCDSTWTGVTNVTLATNTGYQKHGTGCQMATIGSAFTTGKAAYKDMGGAQDISAYQQVSFWIRNSVAIAANSLKLCLCSDTAGNTIIDEFVIPAIPSINNWVALTFDHGAALPANFNSVALYAITDLGAVVVFLDNILACKAPSSADSLTLTSLIGKNTALECWYGIQSIDGVTVILDLGNNCYASHTNNNGYTGTTESVTIYKRETIKTPMVTGTSTVFAQEIDVSGTDQSLINYIGGYNKTSDTVDGLTIFSGQNGNGVGLYYASSNFINTENFGFCRYYNGCGFGSQGSTCANIYCFSNVYNGVEININWFSNLFTYNNSYKGGYLSCNGENLYSYSNNGYGLDLSSMNYKMKNLYIKNNTSYVFRINAACVHMENLYTEGNQLGISNIGGLLWLKNFVFQESFTPMTIYPSLRDHGDCSVIQKFDGVEGDNRLYYVHGVITSESSIRHTASGLSWKFSPTSNSVCWSGFPLSHPIAKVACINGVETTVKLWFRRTNTGITGSLMCKGGQIAGVTNDVSASMTAAIDTWEELSISFTPTETGVVEIRAECYGGSTYNVYVDDLTVI